jgi:hypothetical protein
MYTEGRFLGRFPLGGSARGNTWISPKAGVDLFSGEEAIYCDGVMAYGLRYSGGLIKP